MNLKNMKIGEKLIVAADIKHGKVLAYDNHQGLIVEIDGKIYSTGQPAGHMKTGSMADFEIVNESQRKIKAVS
jgi:hypothetical protein